MILTSRTKFGCILWFSCYIFSSAPNELLVTLLNIAFFYMIELPPRPLLEKLGRELRSRLVWVVVVWKCTYLFYLFPHLMLAKKNLQGLRLFNIDMIRELGTKDRYYIIDINYFPGVVTLLSLRPCHSYLAFVIFISVVLYPCPQRTVPAGIFCVTDLVCVGAKVA